jgi:hypothetical protein
MVSVITIPAVVVIEFAEATRVTAGFTVIVIGLLTAKPTPSVAVTVS